MIEPALSDDAFLADLDLAAKESGTLHMWWLGQSGFLLARGYDRLLLDPYLSDSLTQKYAETDKPHVRMTRRVIEPERLRHIWVTTSSHAHTDHLDAITLRALQAANPMMEFVVPVSTVAVATERSGRVPSVPMDAGETATFGPFTINAVPAAHDAMERDADGHCKYLGYVVSWGTFALYHSGDTVVYDGMVDRLRPFNVDLAILPINGKVGNMGGRDAARLAHDIGAKLVVPCHYEMFEFNTADPRDEFIPECERLGQPYKVLRAGERLTLGA